MRYFFKLFSRADMKATFALMTVIVLWSSAFVGVRYTMTFLSAGVLAFLRCVIASMVMVCLMLKLKTHRIPSIKDILGFLLLGLLGFSIYNLAINHGEMTITAGMANFIVSQIPCIVCIISIIFLREKIKKIAWLGFLLSIIGAAFILVGESSHGEMNIGVLFVYIGALAMAIYTPLQKVYHKRYHPIEITAYSLWGATLFLCVYAPQAWHEISHVDIKTIVIVIYMGVFPSAIAFSLWSYGLRHFSATKAASFLYVMPLFTLTFAWFLLSEIPKTIAILGGVVAVLGSLVINKFGFPTPQKSIHEAINLNE